MSNPDLDDFVQKELERHKSYSANLRADVDQTIRDWAENENDGSSGHHITFDFTTYQYTHTAYPLILQQTVLHDLWYQVIQISKHTEDSHGDQDGLLVQLMSLRATGDIPLPPLEDGRPRIDSFSDGRKFWSELPLFSVDLIEEFTTRYWDRSHYNAYQRNNMAAFIGRLLSVGFYDGAALCALSIFRETLETPRPLLPASKNTDGQQEAPLPVEELIKTIRNIASYSGNGLILLTSNISGAAISVPHLHYADFPDMSAPGDLALQSGLVTSDLRGYSPERWAFWKNRLKELSGCKGSTLAESDKIENGGACPTLAEDADESLGVFTELEDNTRMLE